MGSSPSVNTTSILYKKYFYNPIWWNDYLDKNVELTINSRRTDYVKIACHHFIVCSGIDNKLRVAEWLNSKTPLHIFTCEQFQGKECKFIGKFTLKQVKEAIDAASEGKKYSYFSFNCNSWVEKVINILGIKLKLKWNCYCF